MSEDYEGKMAKLTLKKLAMLSQEMIPLIQDDQDLPSWLQDKFSKLDYYISTVYTYIKFSEWENGSENSEEMEEPEEMESSEQMELSLIVETDQK